MNDIENFFKNNSDLSIHKWQHYFDVYDRHFSRFRGTDVHIVECGVSDGGSLQMWKDYFGPGCMIYGVDINPYCKELEESRVKVFIGDQEGREFLKRLAKDIPRIDHLTDDGGHRMQQQINTFEELFPSIESNGLYFCEDMHTSYWKGWGGGGYRKKGAFIEYTKNFVDYINAWHSQTPKLKATDFARSARSVHSYDSIVIVEKDIVEKPFHIRVGEEKIPQYNPPRNKLKDFGRKFKFFFGFNLAMSPSVFL